jgi:hypothetical protein
MADDDKQPLGAWLIAQVRGGGVHEIPEGTASLPDASDFLDANTVFFKQSGGGKVQAKPLTLPTRDHAETILHLSHLGFHGHVRLPSSPAAARTLKQQLNARLASITEKTNHLARSRTSDESKALDLAGLLQQWMIHGNPAARGKS